MPKVSIITGFYNRVEMVDRTLTSISEQTEPDFECIVFDDNSSDGTANAIRSWIERTKDARFKPYYFEENIGFVSGMIASVSRCQAKYVAVVGSGDIMAPNRIERQLDAFNVPGTVMVDSYLRNSFSASGIEVDWKHDHNDITFEALCAKNTLNHGNVMYSLDAYNKAGGYRHFFRFSQDYDLWLRMHTIGRFGTVPEILYTRFLNSDGVSQKPEKLIYSMRYQWLARDIALGKHIYPGDMSHMEQEYLLDEIYPIASLEMQRAIFRISRNWALLGNIQNAKEFSNYLPKRSYWRYAISIICLISNPILVAISKNANRFFRKSR